MISWKAAKVIQNGILYPMNDGTVWFFDGKTIKEVTPFKVPLPKAK